MARAAACLLALSALAAAAEGPRLNRLAGEKSPYLLQHASDPVDWRPWGPEAFAEARRDGKPVFLSVGFSACHWCHVMQRESFRDGAIAQALNRGFIPVLVDREERPDVDRHYLNACEAAGWSGGWPLTLWLTPGLKPFFGGSYFPPEPRGDLPGLRGLLARVEESWRSRRDDALRDAEDAGAALEAYARVEPSGGAPGAATLDGAFASLRGAFDPAQGSFGGPPLFPSPASLNFLLRYGARTGKKEPREMAARVLRAMAAGAIRDAVSGGFHRYAAGPGWSAPHYEKMLLDNAQLATAYLDASAATADAELGRVGRETLDYLLRGLARPGGGFYASEDADEGYYALASVAERSRRPSPAKDEKILAGHNGLALSALAKGAAVLDEPRYLHAAEQSARFLRDNLYDPKTNRLYRRWRDGERKIPGFAEDYAWTIAGLLDLHEISFDREWLVWATRLAEAQLELFYEPGDGSYRTAPAGSPDELPARLLEDADGAAPSAAAVATLNNLRLSALTGRPEFARAAQKSLKRFGGRMASRPRAYPGQLSALVFLLAKTRRISVAGAPDAADTRALLREIRRGYRPDAVVDLVSTRARAKATVCVATSCFLPTGEPSVLARILEGKSSNAK